MLCDVEAEELFVPARPPIPCSLPPNIPLSRPPIPLESVPPAAMEMSALVIRTLSFASRPWEAELTV